MKLISSQNKTLAMGQKRAAILIALAILLLAVALIIVNYLVGIDTFTDLDGTEYTVKKSDGAYALFDANGYMVETVVEDDTVYYSTDLGTLVTISNSGVAEIFAVVDTEGMESVSDYNNLMMYPRIQTSNIQKLHVTNEYGSYTFERGTDGKMYIRGREDTAYNETLLAYLQSVCGNTTVMQKIRPAAVEQYGFDEYGLDEPAASVTVTAKDGTSHTIHVGKKIVSGSGYYVRLDGSDSVYIFNTYIGNTVLVPLETYVTPALIYPINSNNYMLVQNLRVDSLSYDESGKLITDNDIALTYWDYAERENTEFQSQPYVMTDEAFSGYTPSADAVYTVMYNFLEMQYKQLITVDATAEDLAKYGLDKPVKSLYFEFTETNTATGITYHAKNYVFFSEITENGTHYVTSSVYVSNDNKQNYIKWPTYNQIVEIDRSLLPFLEWESLDWYERDYFRLAIDLCDKITFTTDDYKVTFDIVPVGDDVEAYLVTDKGNQKLAINNFKTLYLNMQYGKLFGSTQMSDEEIAAVIADKSRHVLSWSMNTTVTGIERTYDYYWLDENRTLVTVNGVGEFYVLTSAVEKLISDARDVANGIKITAVSPYTNIDK